MNTNPHHRNSEKFHFRAVQKIQAKLANIILEKYDEIGKILAGMIFRFPPNQYPKMVSSKSPHRETCKFYPINIIKIWIATNN